MADAIDSKSVSRKGVGVRVPPPAPLQKTARNRGFFVSRHRPGPKVTTKVTTCPATSGDAHRGRGGLEPRTDGTGRVLVKALGPSISTHEIIGSLPLKDLGAAWLIPWVSMGVSDGQHLWVVASESVATGTSRPQLPCFPHGQTWCPHVSTGHESATIRLDGRLKEARSPAGFRHGCMVNHGLGTSCG